MRTDLEKQLAIDKLKLIANQEEGVQLTMSEAEFLQITSLNDDSILEVAGGIDGDK